MKALVVLLVVSVLIPFAIPAFAMSDEELRSDWAQLSQYASANASLKSLAKVQNRIVFFGDSITEFFPIAELFPQKPYINRGIKGQTTPQMLVRFRQDVLDLRPSLVVILAGTNDLAQNTGVETLEQIEGNFQSMCELAKSNKIDVVLCSVLPAKYFYWKLGIYPSEKIKQLNDFLRSYASRNGYGYVDYYSAMADKDGGLRADLAKDAVHPNKAGYQTMATLVRSAIQTRLQFRAEPTIIPEHPHGTNPSGSGKPRPQHAH